MTLTGSIYQRRKILHVTFNMGFGGAEQEIRHLVDQMDEADRYAYLVESLFLNTVTYENEKLGAYMRKLTKQP